MQEQFHFVERNAVRTVIRSYGSSGWLRDRSGSDAVRDRAGVYFIEAILERIAHW